jgi:pSer/pThr/pTyr-binding forkhead associated (FHA) protein
MKAAKATAMWILQGSSEGDGKTFVFRMPAGATRVIGRAPRADFIMDAALVSRLHCRLSADADRQITVVDLDSTNGTYVNGNRVQKGAVTAGGTLRVGRVELLVSKES